jgi:hypothetical protein
MDKVDLVSFATPETEYRLIGMKVSVIAKDIIKGQVTSSDLEKDFKKVFDE